MSDLYPRPPADEEEREACDNFARSDGAEWCGVILRDPKVTPWMCTRRKQHAGKHVAVCNGRVLATWPQAPAAHAGEPAEMRAPLPDVAALVEEAGRLSAAATPGAWSTGRIRVGGPEAWVSAPGRAVVESSPLAETRAPADIIFIARARTLVPEMAAALASQARDLGAAREEVERLRQECFEAREATEALREEIRHARVSLTWLDGEGIVAAAERMREVLDDRENHRRAAWAFVEEMEAAAREALDIPRNPDPDIHMEPGDIRAAGERLRARLAEVERERDESRLGGALLQVSFDAATARADEMQRHAETSHKMAQAAGEREWATAQARDAATARAVEAALADIGLTLDAMEDASNVDGPGRASWMAAIGMVRECLTAPAVSRG